MLGCVCGSQEEIGCAFIPSQSHLITAQRVKSGLDVKVQCMKVGLGAMAEIV